PVPVDGGQSRNDVRPRDLTPGSKVTRIDACHVHRLTAYFAGSRFRVDDPTPLIFRTHDGGQTWTKITTGLPANAPVNVVREDPVRRGLLFAGTERDVYVSFDDGGAWQPITLNLPHSSMRDLAVHGDDLIVATHGRSFWILDDLTPLRQLSATVAGAGAYLYKPARAWRMRRNNNTDTPLPPEVPAGQDPPDGAIIDYSLREPAPGGVTLEIFTAAGKLVRRYKSSDPPESIESIDGQPLNVPLYWIRRAGTPSADKGMHRFVWDLHYPAPKALRRENPISATYMDTPPPPPGPVAPPGPYPVKVTVNGPAFERPLTVKMDPRVRTPPLGLQRQFALASHLADMMRQEYEALMQVRAARGSQGADGPLAGLERELVALNSDLTSVYEMIEGADASPTVQATRTVAALQQSLSALLTRWNRAKR